jgi:hypothetical protein
MSHPVELVRSRGEDTLWPGPSQRCRRKGASNKGELEVGLDKAKELSR